jgi:hypothetical protein
LVEDDETSNDTAFTTTAETTPSSSMSPSLSDIAFDGDDISIDDDFSFIKVEDDFLTSVVTSESSPDDRSGMVQTPDLFLGLLDDERYMYIQRVEDQILEIRFYIVDVYLI